MYRIPLIFSLFWLLSGSGSFAQKTKADSLLTVLKSAPADSNRINTLLELNKVFGSRNIDSARMFVSEAIRIAEASGNKKQHALALKTMGNSYYQKDNNAALDYWEKSLSLYRSIQDSSGEANLLSNIGALYMNEGDDSKAMEYYVRALELGELLKENLRIATALNNMGSIYNHNESTRPRALEMYHRSLPLSEARKDLDAVGTTYFNIAEVNLSIGKNDSALYYSLKSLKTLEGTEKVFLPLKVLGDMYDSLKNYSRALSYYQQADSIATRFRNQRYEIQSKIGLGDLYFKVGDYKKSIEAYAKAEELARLTRQNFLLKDAYKGLARNYAIRNDYLNAFNVQQLLTALNDTLSNADMRKRMFGLTYNYELQKRESEISLLTKDKQIADANLRRQKFAKNALIAGLGLVSLIIFILYRDYLNKIKTNKILDNQKIQIQGLLSNILPDEVAEELQRDGVATPRFYESASVLFTDFKSFTKLADSLSPQEVVAELNSCFNVFDDIIVRYGLEKIKTIGDAYMCAGGIPVEDPDHYKKMVRAARDIQQYIRQRNQEREVSGLQPWEIRIGIHVGPIVAGVVGKKKYAYDIWGSTVNIASRMESNGEPGQINISSALYELVKEKYHCTYRGKIYAKNVGEIDMYFLGDEIKEGERRDMPDSNFAVQNSFLDLPLSDKQQRLPAIDKYDLIRQTALHRLKDLDPGLTYHCFDHTLDVLEHSERIAAAEGVRDPEKMFVLKVAALYHDTGFLKTYRNHEEASFGIFLEDAPKFGFTDAQVSEIERLIMVTKLPQTPLNIMEKVICDADLDYLGRDDFFTIGDTLRREFILYGVVPDDAAWEALQMKFLTNHSYHTESSRLLREPKKQAHIRRLMA
jgi:adenylate cyclase